MCRHLAYLGPPVPLSRLLFDAPHGLAHQSWAPRDMRGGGTINADGFGIGWFPDPSPLTSPPVVDRSALPLMSPPVVYRSARPLWSDPSLPAMAAATSSGAVLAAVRSATVGMPVTESAAAPFHDGPWLFSHNGRVAGWPDSVTDVAAALPVRDLITLDAPTDSALLWALVRARLRAGSPLGDAVSAVVAAVAAAAPGSRLNLLLTDGRSIAAVAYGHALCVLVSAGVVLVASEPLDDDPGWRPVPEHSLLVADPSAVHISEGAFS